MKLLMYGVNQDLVERDNKHCYQLDKKSAIAQINDIRSFTGVCEAVILYSNYRTEYYFVVDEKIFNHGEFLRYLSGKSNRPLEKVILETFSKFNDDVVNHILRCLAGVDESAESTEELMDAFENSIFLSDSYFNQKLHVLRKLFSSSIYFVISLIKSSSMNISLDSEADEVIKASIDEYPSFNTTRFLLIGTADKIARIARMLFRANARYIRLQTGLPGQNKQLVSSLNEWANWMNPQLKRKVFFSVDDNAMLYHFCTADSVILANQLDKEGLTKKLNSLDCNECFNTPKKQLILDLCEQKSLVNKQLGLHRFIYKNFFEENGQLSDRAKEKILDKIVQKISTQRQLIFDNYSQYIKLIEQ